MSFSRLRMAEGERENGDLIREVMTSIPVNQLGSASFVSRLVLV